MEGGCKIYLRFSIKQRADQNFVKKVKYIKDTVASSKGFLFIGNYNI